MFSRGCGLKFNERSDVSGCCVSPRAAPFVTFTMHVRSQSQRERNIEKLLVKEIYVESIKCRKKSDSFDYVRIDQIPKLRVLSAASQHHVLVDSNLSNKNMSEICVYSFL